MIRDSLSLLTTLLFAAILCAQAAQVSSPPMAGTVSPVPGTTANELGPGTILSVELSKSLDAKKLKANDKFEARTVIDLLAHGHIVIPRNTKIIGHVTEAKGHTKQSPGAVVGIAFDKALMKDGRELPLQAAVQAVGRPLQTAPAFPQDDPMAATAGGCHQPRRANAERNRSFGGNPVSESQRISSRRWRRIAP